MSIILEQLHKRYDNHPIVNHVSLEVANGEFFVLLGSSGSGKTTILNLISGLTLPDEGRVLLNGRDVTWLTPQERQVGFVFQNYALFQHMTVTDNIEFGLRVRRVAAAERRRRRDELLELVGLTGFGGRMPRQLSGGQQQRVALARALAHRPEVLLLDEPLGALDAKIRIELRRTLRAIQRELGITTILVTHDQEEAFELADRLGVMSFGRLLEVGPPHDLYLRPQTEFVATFLGTANLLLGQAVANGVQVGTHHFKLPPSQQPLPEERRVQVLFRPEDVTLSLLDNQMDCPVLGLGKIEQQLFLGAFERLRLRLPALPNVRVISPPIAFGESGLLVEATRTQDEASRQPLQIGQEAYVGIRRIHVLAHPGLRFLILTDGSSMATLTAAGQLARLTHARVTLLVYGLAEDHQQAHLQRAKERLGSGLTALETRLSPYPAGEAVANEVEQQPYDLVITAFTAEENQVRLAEQILEKGEHHLLLVSASLPLPSKALISVTGGEPGKGDVLFTGRLIRHLGAEARLMAVLPDRSPLTHQQATRFLDGGVKTLESLGVPAESALRFGPVRDEIISEVEAGNYEMLVLGCPLPDLQGHISLNGVVSQILHHNPTYPVLIIKTPQLERD